MRLVGIAPALLLAACRIGFDPTEPAGSDARAATDASRPGDGVAPDGGASTAGGDASSAQTIACADVQLGSALGASVASGTTSGRANSFAGCSGDAADVSFAWFAPITAVYEIDLCASPSGYDSVLSVRFESCAGAELACDDDGCGSGIGIPSRLTLPLAAGQGIVIVIDGDSSDDDGTYQLAIRAQ